MHEYVALTPLNLLARVIAAEQIMHALPGAVLPPAPAVLVDNLPGGKVMEQRAPGPAPTAGIEDRVQNFALRILLRSAAWFGGGDQMLNQRPFTVPEVSWVRFAGIHASGLPKVVDPRQSF
ncbi:MAG TPA: hypothetical protein VLK82_27865 [Candidatus Tectomicrobia bacterium]|nr:hypothetical protein [Candidatus Tectomicrobia bacterium]